jgi:hypothetical protein
MIILWTDDQRPGKAPREDEEVRPSDKVLRLISLLDRVFKPAIRGSKYYAALLASMHQRAGRDGVQELVLYGLGNVEEPRMHDDGRR